MSKPLLGFEEVRSLLKQRFPMLMVDTVVALEPGKSIRATKNITGNELHFLGHFPERAVMPGTLIVEAIGQAASILFSKTTEIPIENEDFLVLGSIQDMRFLVPVVPGEKMEIEVHVLKILGDLAFVESVVTVDGTIAVTGKLGFARRKFSTEARVAPRTG
jgi:3-hydroxyacyl-[acyl-carrier-protein] dehydratase